MREIQTQLLHYFSKSDNKSNHHLASQLASQCLWQPVWQRPSKPVWQPVCQPVWRLLQSTTLARSAQRTDQYCQPSTWTCYLPHAADMRVLVFSNIDKPSPCGHTVCREDATSAASNRCQSKSKCRHTRKHLQAQQNDGTQTTKTTKTTKTTNKTCQFNAKYDLFHVSLYRHCLKSLQIWLFRVQLGLNPSP